MPLKEIQAYYESVWKKNFHDRVVIVEEGRTADDYFRLGLKFIEDYYQHYHPFNQNRILGLEQKIEVNLDRTRRYILQGYVDRIDLTPEGVYEIHDYKTSSALPGQKEADSDRQLALYQLGLQQKWPQAEKVRLVWHYVAFDMEICSTRTPEQLEELKGQVIDLIEQIEAESEFPPQESVLCNWCAFWDYCPLKKHEVELRKLPENEYLNEEGLVLVDRYIEYYDQKKEAEAELEKLKEAIIKYAEGRGLQRVTGSEYHLTLSKKDLVRFPAKGKEERQRLEGIIKQAGLWERFTGLDLNSLERAILENTLDKDISEKLSNLVSKEKLVTLRPAKKKETENSEDI
jgi:putative RecB family exonuclease